MSSPIKWAVIQGNFDLGKDLITFHGKPLPLKNAKGEDEGVGLDIGIVMSNARFLGGDISAEIEFNKIDVNNACEIIFYYDAASTVQISAGIGTFGSFCIRQWDGSK